MNAFGEKQLVEKRTTVNDATVIAANKSKKYVLFEKYKTEPVGLLCKRFYMGYVKQRKGQLYRKDMDGIGRLGREEREALWQGMKISKARIFKQWKKWVQDNNPGTEIVHDSGKSPPGHRLKSLKLDDTMLDETRNRCNSLIVKIKKLENLCRLACVEKKAKGDRERIIKEVLEAANKRVEELKAAEKMLKERES